MTLYQRLPTTILVEMSVLAVLVTAMLTNVVRRAAIKSSRLDLPNERSMHAAPVPRGGGLAIVAVFLLLILTVAVLHADMWSFTAVLVCGGLMVAGVGWLDDKAHVSPGIRAAVHLGAATLAAGLVYQPIDTTTRMSNLALNGCIVLSAILIAYLVNLYNFMDGLDGLAGSTAAFAGITGGLVLLCVLAPPTMVVFEQLYGPKVGELQPVAIASILVGCCSLGFLYQNWPPAKVFMGDVGSGFLGFAFGTLLTASAWIEASLLWTWLILLATFIADATFTLVVRVVTGQRWYEAHRLHAFQKLGIRWGSHKRVTLSFLAVDVLWLLPLALISVFRPDLGPFLTAIAYLPLIAVAAVLKAGIKEEQPVSATSVAQ